MNDELRVSSRSPHGARRPLLVIAMACLASVYLVSCGCAPSSDEVTAGAAVDARVYEQRGGITFVNDPTAASQLAQSLGRPCLLFFTAEWCTYCHMMEESAFHDPAVAELAENFVCVVVDADQHQRLCEYYSVKGYPTIQFIDLEGRTLHRLVGRQSAETLVGGMQSALRRQAWVVDIETQRR